MNIFEKMFSNQQKEPVEKGLNLGKFEVRKIKIKCLSCKKEVEAQFIRSEKGYFSANCPDCGGVAYNSKVEPTPI